MKHNKTMIIIAFLSFILTSCSQSGQSEVRDKKDNEYLKVNNEKPIVINKATTKERLKPKTDNPASFGKRSISINGEKFIYGGGGLSKGTIVRNIHMSESGRIKGSIVVVVKAGEILKVPLISFKSKTRIAKGTFRLIPSQTDDLMAVYKELLLNESIAIVELEVAYSSKGNRALEY